MSVKEIMPFISCICNEEDFEEAKVKYSEIYVYTPEGILKYVKMKYDRFICLNVDKIPNLKPTIQPSFNFLPAGKLPYHLFLQIVAFFKKVIEVKKSSVEAHIHILWNPTQGYHLAVPNQRVSAASVSYDFEHIGKDDIIIADFHSHNSMGAFYSGTDENDDRNKTYYTGVIGKLNLPKYEYKLRFNYNELKHNCDLDTLFEMNEETVDVPESWLEKIETQTYTHYGRGKGKNKDDKKQGKDSRFDPNDDSHYNGIGFGFGGSAEDWKAYLDMEDRSMGKASPSSSQKSQESLAAGEENHDSRFQELTLNPKTGLMEPLENLSSQNKANHNPTSSEETESTRYIRKSHGVNQQDPCYMDYLIAQYGEETANGYDQAAAGIMDMDGADEPLLDLIREAYSRLSTSAQMELGQTGL